MNTRSQIYKRGLALLCAVLFLVCTPLLFLLHDHEHTVDTDCEICTIIDLWRELLLGSILAMVFGCFVYRTTARLCAYAYVAALNETTLVGRKVKLSN